MANTFVLRVDLESDKGIKKGLPVLLDLMKKYEIKGSFYLVMGGESNLFEILFQRKKLQSSGERKLKVFTLLEKIRMLLFPKDFVKENVKILKRILEEGHELGLHGWKHRAWTRNLEKINIKNHVNKSIKKYKKVFGKEPISFAAPGFNTNEKILKILRKKRIKFISDFSGKKEKICFSNIKNVPITICGKNKTPIIEYLVGAGKNDFEIIEYLKEKIKKENLASIYLHGLYEPIFKKNVLEETLKFVFSNKIKNRRIIDFK